MGRKRDYEPKLRGEARHAHSIRSRVLTQRQNRDLTGFAGLPSRRKQAGGAFWDDASRNDDARCEIQDGFSGLS